MSVQTVFKRYELKYILTKEQKEKIMIQMSPFMELDQFGRKTIRNLYYDTDSFLLVRRSIEKPVYKEKLRVRSYGRASEDSKVFVELKKKYDHVVYKRRVELNASDAFDWIHKGKKCVKESQIVDEINYFLGYYEGIHPRVHLSYEREAFFTKEVSDFRVTFDENILYRQEELSLSSENYGSFVLPKDLVLMELKCPGAIPLWMTRILSEEKLYKQSFSKYGTAYGIINNRNGEF